MFFTRFSFLLTLLVGFTLAVQAQNATKVLGRLTDKQKKPVSFATVTLMRPDSSVVGGFLTEEDGKFSIDAPGYGSYLLRASGIGINTKTLGGIVVTAEQPEKNLGDISVSVTAQALQEVEITGEKAMMEMNVDKKVFNVEKNITTVGGSASDVLQNIPSVSVDVDGGVSLRGKSGALILIDGKPATLLGGDEASALQSLPAASVQSVEVITNPSSKYDAQGMTGIINIVTKKDKKFGLNGSVSAGAGTRDKYNGSLNLNLKNKTWNIFLNSSFRQNRNYNRTTNERTNYYDNASFYSYEDNIRSFGGFFNSLGAEYTIDERNSLTLTQNINRMSWGGNGYSLYNVYSSPESQVSAQRRSSYNLGGPLSSSSAMDYKHKFKKEKQEITTNATFAKTWVTREQEYETNLYDGVGNLRSGPVYQNAPGSGSNTSLNAQTDFTTPFLSAKGKLEAGLKTQLFWFESSNNPTIDSGYGKQVDYILLNNYDYLQQTHAAYTSFSDQKGKWSYQGGLRLEYALYEGTAYSLNGTYSNEFLNLFPSAFVSYAMKHEQSMYLNYSRRVNRPRFMQLMPYVDLSNPQDTNMGNPDLIPEFIDNVEMSYSKQFKQGHNLIVSVYYQYMQNMIERYRLFYPDGTSFTQPQNLTAGTTYGLEMTGKAQITKIWDATLSFNFFQNEILGTNIDPLLNNSGFSWFGKANTNIKLPAGFSVQLNGNYEAPKIAGQGRLEEVYWVDVALRKNLLKNKATLVLNVSDIFNTRKYTTLYEYPQYVQSTYRDRETRIGNINFTYRFGRSESSGPKMPGGNSRRGKQQAPANSDKKQDKDRQNLKSEDGGGDQGNF